jgi:hypothetical protein
MLRTFSEVAVNKHQTIFNKGLNFLQVVNKKSSPIDKHQHTSNISTAFNTICKHGYYYFTLKPGEKKYLYFNQRVLSHRFQQLYQL